MADATAEFAGISIFCKLGCSQVYHCVQMADPLSVQLLAFNFACRAMAYQRLARSLNRSVAGFSALENPLRAMSLSKCLHTVHG